MSEIRPTDPNVLQRLASDPESSVWVGASAGTGKTKVLTDRVLRLMLAGTDPSRILCLTFTKAAAAEMANRIADRLSVWAVADEERLRANLLSLTGHEPSRADVVAARRLFARVLDTAGGMKIQTIHAFCQSLLRRFPLEAGLAPNFEVMDDRTAEELLAEAKQSVLLAGRYEPDSILAGAVALLTGAVSEDDFNELLASLTAERGRLRRILEAQGGLEPAIAALRDHLRVPAGETDLDVLARACATGAVDEAGLRRACAVLATGTKSDVERGIGIQAWLDADPSWRLKAWAEYQSLYLTTEGEPRKSLMTKKPSEADPMALEILQREAARLVAVTEERRRVAVATHTAALLALGEALLDRYQRLKDARGVLDFDDLILSASTLLSNDAAAACAWVLFKLDGGLDHVLIDEAQDTNPEQWAVVSAIAEEFFAGLGARDDRIRTLFVVGDDKQSIFSFQRADPAEFARMRRHFDAKVNAARRNWRIVDLQTSFRSVGAVLAAVDRVFAGGMARDGVAAPEVEVRHIPFRRGMEGRVEIWPLVSPQDVSDPDPWSLPLEPEQADKPVARLARTMADRIASWLSDGERLVSRNRPLRPGDIMVLVRSRDQFVGHLVRALKDRDVPVAGVDRMVLTEQLAVMDLMALARFLVLPEDDLTLAVLLKSPLVGLTEEQLFQVAHGRPGRLWQALTEKAKTDTALGAAWDYLRAILNDTDYRAPYELFAGVLSRPCPADPDGSGRRAILGRLGSEAQDPLEEFLNACLLFEREHVASLQGFLHWLEASEAEIKRELDTGGGDGPGQVRIMTVHGSKGLQAPIVFLPDTMREPDVNRLKILWPARTLPGEGTADPGPPLPLYVPRRHMEDATADARRALARQRQDQEYRRLLYVALTRAEDRLIICGWEQQRKSGSQGSWYRLVEGALADLARPEPFDFTGLSASGWAGPGLVLHEPQTVPVPGAPPPAAEVAASTMLPDWALSPAPKDPSPSRPLAPSQPDAPEPSLRSPLGPDDGLRFKRGNLIHTLLQVLPETAPDRWAETAAAWLARPTHNLTPVQQQEIAAEALRVLTDPGFAPLFGPGSRAEVPLVGLVGDRALSGRIDRLCVTEDAVWIVDYKTNRPPPTEVAKVPVIYLQQMAAYRAALARIYPGKAVRCVLLWTDGPFTMELPGDLLDLHGP